MAAPPIVRPSLKETVPLGLAVEKPQGVRVAQPVPSRPVVRPILAARGKNWFAEAMFGASPTRPHSVEVDRPALRDCYSVPGATEGDQS